MSKHTPGPWVRFTAAGGQPAIKQDGPKGKYLFDVSEYAGLGDEAEANARLIAAAPDLLAVAQMFAQYLADNGGDEQFHNADGTGWLTIARAAIAKAEGVS